MTGVLIPSQSSRSAYNKPGRWASPIQVDWLAERTRLGDVQWDSCGKNLYWWEGVSGVGRICRSSINGTRKVTSGDRNVRGRVGYGGGEFAVAGDFMVFTDKEGQLIRSDFNADRIYPITPAWGGVAHPLISPNRKWVVFIFSDGHTDLLAVVNARGLGWPMQLVRGADFYMQPAFHPTGEQLAWVEWNHPHMPWQAGRLKIGEVGGMQLRLFSEQWIAGDENMPASQPQFSPDGRWLSYIQNTGEWDTLVIMNLRSRKRRTILAGEQILLSPPTWVQGVRTYGWSHDSQHIFIIQNYAGRCSLWKVRIKDGKGEQMPAEPFQWLTQLTVSPLDDSLAMTASSPFEPKQIVLHKNGRWHSIASSFEHRIENAYLPEPQSVQWLSVGGKSVYGWYYPPTNPEYTLSGLPPLMIHVHGGPTDQNTLAFDASRAFFTSRGFALLAVDYRGSSGYGRIYQDAIRHHWGVVDVQDVVSGAREMVSRGLADQESMALLGSSAGGLTVLNVLIQHPGLFRCAVCSYPVTDLIADATQTHKFERFYHRYLIGDLQKDSRRFRQRSPLFHANKICDPMALFHGEDDPVVSPQQSVQIAQNLQSRGIPCLLRLYAGEGHGFRKQETMIDYYNQVLQFLQTYLCNQ
jgi:dipeptidyl aminopeptidase/acylaminoacyl peptidase